MNSSFVDDARVSQDMRRDFESVTSCTRVIVVTLAAIVPTLIGTDSGDSNLVAFNLNGPSPSSWRCVWKW